MAMEEFFEMDQPSKQSAQLPSLNEMLPQPAEIQANAGSPHLAQMLRLMQEGFVTQPMWFTDPEKNRAVVMVPIDITSMTPAMNKQLQDLMALNAKRAPRQ